MKISNVPQLNVFDGAVECLMSMKGSSSEAETLRIEPPFIHHFMTVGPFQVAEQKTHWAASWFFRNSTV